MILEEQVTSLDLSKVLKVMDFKQKTLFYWQSHYLNPAHKDNYWTLRYPIDENGEHDPKDNWGSISAYTVAELGEFLPERFYSYWDMVSGYWYCWPNPENEKFRDMLPTIAMNEAEARGKMLVNLRQRKLI